MNITYPNGRVVKALLRSRSQGELCVTVAGCGDVLSFTLINGAWMCGETEAVTIAPDGQRSVAPKPRPEDDRVCANVLPSSRISTLLNGCKRDITGASTLYASSLI